MKKFLAIVMCLTMALAMMTVTSFAADYTVAGKSVTVAPGEVVDIPVTISNSITAGMGQIDLIAPAGVNFELVAGSATPSLLSGGKIQIYFDSDATLSGTLYTIKVTAPETAGTYAFAFNMDNTMIMDNVEYAPVDCDFVDFTLTVEAAATQGDPVMTVVPAEEGTSLMVLEPVGTPVEMGVIYEGEGEYNGAAFKSLAPAGAKAAVKVIGLTGTFAPYANY